MKQDDINNKLRKKSFFRSEDSNCSSTMKYYHDNKLFARVSQCMLLLYSNGASIKEQPIYICHNEIKTLTVKNIDDSGKPVVIVNGIQFCV